MKNRGSGKFGVEFKVGGKEPITQWFPTEHVRKEAYHNYCRGTKYDYIKMVSR